MSLRVFVRPRARQDLLEHYIFIAADDPEAAVRVIDVAQRAFTMLAGMPDLGAVVGLSLPRLSGLRRWVLPEFTNYVVYYLASGESLEIVRILHGAREQASELRRK